MRNPVVYRLSLSELHVPRKPRIPTLRRHRTWNLGVVTLNGKDYYLGQWQSDAAEPPDTVRAAYDRLIADWLNGGRQLAPRPDSAKSPGGLTVNHVLLAYFNHARDY